MNEHDGREILARIESLDLEPIRFKLVHENQCTREQAVVLEKWYKRFLFLAARHPEQPIVVSEAIDMFWHQHILDTRKYADDCSAAIGAFLHHFPYFGLRGEDDANALRAAYEATCDLMRKEFGETPDKELIGLHAMTGTTNGASSCSDCGGGNCETFIGAFNEVRPRFA